MDVCQDLFYASGWPSRPLQPIFKVKRVAKRTYPQFRRFSWAIASHYLGDPDLTVKLAKTFCGRPWETWLCNQLDLTATPIHFLGKTSSEARIPSTLTIFVCYCNPFFGWYGFRHQKCQKFCGHPSIPWLCSRLDLTACPTHFKVKKEISREARIPPPISSKLLFGWSRF